MIEDLEPPSADGEAALADAPPPPVVDDDAPPAETPKRGGRRPATPKPEIVEQRVEVHVRELRAALKGVVDVVEAKNTIPILANLLFEAADGRLTLTGTDLDMWVQRSLDLVESSGGPGATGAHDGPARFATTVSARVLSAITAKIDPDAVMALRLAEGAHRIIVTAGRSRFQLPVLPVEDFPVPLAIEPQHQFEMPGTALRELIAGVRFAVSTEETRFYLNGIYLQAAERIDDDVTLMVLRGVATDGHRLARFDVDQPDGAGALDGVIVGRKTIGVIDKLLDGRDGPIGIEIAPLRIRFDLGETLVTAKLIDGSFPDYTRVIPTANERMMRVDCSALTEAAERVMLMAAGKAHAVKVELDRDRVTLSSTSPELGDAIEEVPCDHDGTPMTIGFNGRSLIEILGRIASGRAEVALGDEASPTLIVDTEPGARGLYVIMPMRV